MSLNSYQHVYFVSFDAWVSISGAGIFRNSSLWPSDVNESGPSLFYYFSCCMVHFWHIYIGYNWIYALNLCIVLNPHISLSYIAISRGRIIISNWVWICLHTCDPHKLLISLVSASTIISNPCNVQRRCLNSRMIDRKDSHWKSHPNLSVIRSAPAWSRCVIGLRWILRSIIRLQSVFVNSLQSLGVAAAFCAVLYCVNGPAKEQYSKISI
jgi:hypothetical protein